jgi:hypothetical protein
MAEERISSASESDDEIQGLRREAADVHLKFSAKMIDRWLVGVPLAVAALVCGTVYGFARLMANLIEIWAPVTIFGLTTVVFASVSVFLCVIRPCRLRRQMDKILRDGGLGEADAYAAARTAVVDRQKQVFESGAKRVMAAASDYGRACRLRLTAAGSGLDPGDTETSAALRRVLEVRDEVNGELDAVDRESHRKIKAVAALLVNPH